MSVIARVVASLRILFAVAIVCAITTMHSANAEAGCPPACNGLTLTVTNFSHQDLTDANFEGATIIGGVFIRANLTGANFNNATFQSVAGNPNQVPDFSFANLTHATFVAAKFEAPTYFNYATLTCADFSQTNINNGNAIFGDEPLVYTPTTNCRTTFAGTTMNCEFINDWRAFDLTGADVTACVTLLSGRNFANAIMAKVNLDNAILDGAVFTKANLTQARLNGASLQCLPAAGAQPQRCVDLSAALLQGAKLNNANLSGATLNNAFLSNNVDGKILEAASLHQAHLKNVNLSFAQLSGVDFTSANFYGDVPANNPNGCATTRSNNAGFTNGCASAHGANMNGTVFADAYLYGVDFSNAAIAGANFHDAVLVGANFAGASIGPSSSSGAATAFFNAYLQGTNLDQASALTEVDLTNAFVDFRSGGNLIFINLNGIDHNSFACGSPSTCKPSSGGDVCVWVRYPITTVPASNPTLTCPDGSTGNCGMADARGGNVHWKSTLNIGAPPDPGPPPGWYSNAATYTPAAAEPTVCNGKGPTARVLNW